MLRRIGEDCQRHLPQTTQMKTQIMTMSFWAVTVD